MTYGFLICTFGDTYLYDCITSIRMYHEDVPIFIVDNNMHSPMLSFDSKSMIHYTKNNQNTFELGALLHAHEVWCHVKKFILIQNSMTLLQRLPNIVFTEKFVAFWNTKPSSYAPAVSIMEKKMKSINLNFKFNSRWSKWYSICGCCCSIDSDIISSLKKIRFNTIISKSKSEAVVMEILFGYVIYVLFEYESVNTLHNHPLHEHITLKKPYTIIKKNGFGQGNVTNTHTYIPSLFKSKIYSIFYDQNNKITNNQKFLNIFEYAEDNSYFHDWLVYTEMQNIVTSHQLLTNMLHVLRHRSFMRKYFPLEYEQEKKSIFEEQDGFVFF